MVAIPLRPFETAREEWSGRLNASATVKRTQ